MVMIVIPVIRGFSPCQIRKAICFSPCYTYNFLVCVAIAPLILTLIKPCQFGLERMHCPIINYKRGALVQTSRELGRDKCFHFFYDYRRIQVWICFSRHGVLQPKIKKCGTTCNSVQRIASIGQQQNSKINTDTNHILRSIVIDRTCHHQLKTKLIITNWTGWTSCNSQTMASQKLIASKESDNHILTIIGKLGSGRRL